MIQRTISYHGVPMQITFSHSMTSPDATFEESDVQIDSALVGGVDVLPMLNLGQISDLERLVYE